MNEQCEEGGRNFALSAYGTICRRDEVKQMSREIAKGLQRKEREREIEKGLLFQE